MTQVEKVTQTSPETTIYLFLVILPLQNDNTTWIYKYWTRYQRLDGLLIKVGSGMWFKTVTVELNCEFLSPQGTSFSFDVEPEQEESESFLSLCTKVVKRSEFRKNELQVRSC